MLTNLDIAELTEWRRARHAEPELSGQEHRTAAQVAQTMAALSPDALITGLGGTGVAAVFAGAAPGPTVMLRAELDGLPIAETGQPPHRSRLAGQGHMCGHDGHMAILVGLARLLARQRPPRGRVVILFQPAEETGAGARAVLADPRFADLRPDWAFALHNMPGLPLGHVALRAGPMACASAGLRVALRGRTSHAAAPEAGRSPALALAALIPALSAAAPGGALVPGFRLATVTHARLGAASFGVAPGEAELWVTLRALVQADMDALRTEAGQMVADQVRAHGLEAELTDHEVFAACTNDPEATGLLLGAVHKAGLTLSDHGMPMRASEDFGLFGDVARSAMLLIGAGQDQPMLHAPDYDFPDALIAPSVGIFHNALHAVLG